MQLRRRILLKKSWQGSTSVMITKCLVTCECKYLSLKSQADSIITLLGFYLFATFVVAVVSSLHVYTTCNDASDGISLLGNNIGCRQCQSDPSFPQLRSRADWHFGKCQYVPLVFLWARLVLLSHRPAACTEMKWQQLCFSCSKWVSESQNTRVLKYNQSDRKWLLLSLVTKQVRVAAFGFKSQLRFLIFCLIRRFYFYATEKMELLTGVLLNTRGRCESF